MYDKTVKLKQYRTPSSIGGTEMTSIMIIPAIATEPFITLILPSTVEYASLIEDPTIGIRLPIRNFILFDVTESIATESTPLTESIAANPLERIPITVDISLFVPEINLFKLIVLFKEKAIDAERKIPVISEARLLTINEISCANTNVTLLYVIPLDTLPPSERTMV
jgi:hypothetical protein